MLQLAIRTICLCVLFAITAQADTITMTDGRTFTGQVVSEDSTGITIEVMNHGIRAKVQLAGSEISSTVKEKLPAGFFDSSKAATQPTTGPSGTEGKLDPSRIRGQWLQLIGAGIEDRRQKLNLVLSYDRYALTDAAYNNSGRINLSLLSQYEGLKKTVLAMSESDLRRRIEEAKSHQEDLLDKVNADIQKNSEGREGVLEFSHRHHPGDGTQVETKISLEQMDADLQRLKKRKNYIVNLAFPELLATTERQIVVASVPKKFDPGAQADHREPAADKGANHESVVKDTTLKTWKGTIFPKGAASLESFTDYCRVEKGNWAHAYRIFKARYPNSETLIMDLVEVSDDN